MDDATSAPESLSGLTTPELTARITELAGHLNAANRRWLALIAEFDRRQGWSDGFTHSCAHWLNWQCGLDLGAAREKVRVAHALEELPLMVAQHGTAHHVEKLVRQFRRVQEVEELSREERQQANRRLTYSYDEDGSLVIRARLPAEVGTLVVKALDAAIEDIPLPGTARDVSAETFSANRPTLSTRRADALDVLAESFLKHGAEAMNGGERQQIVVHVDGEALQRRSTGRCELEDGPAIPLETARRLSCDASIVKIVEDTHGAPLDVGRKTRSISPSLRRALNSRDQGCVFPGCTHKRYVDGHHIHHWAEGGETKLTNLVSLCRAHHRAVHEGGVVIQRLDDGAWRFINRNGEALEACAPGRTRPFVQWSQLVAANEMQGIRIDATTAATRWRGERMDYGIAIDLLIARARRWALSPRPVSHVSAETSALGQQRPRRRSAEGCRARRSQQSRSCGRGQAEWSSTWAVRQRTDCPMHR